MKWVAPLVLTASSAVMFTAMLGGADFVTSHEARVAQTARQMADAGAPWDRGARLRVPDVELRRINGAVHLLPVPHKSQRVVNPWVVPVMNGQVRLNKPPLPYWCTAIAFALLGYAEWQARIVPALLGILSTLLIYDLARRIFGRRAALPAAAVWLTTHFVLESFRIATADAFLAFFTLLAVWSWAARSNRRGRSGAFTTLAYASVALGLLAKGPVILLTTLPAVLLLQPLVRKNPAGSWRTHLLGVAVATLIALPWFAAILHCFPVTLELWRFESIGQFADNTEKARPWWTYVATALQLPLPWTPIWIAGIALWLMHGRRGIASRRGKRRAWAMAWLLSGMLVLSMAHVKKAAYLLPLLPAQTLLIGDALATAVMLRYRWARAGIFTATAQWLIGCGAAVVLFVSAPSGEPTTLVVIALSVLLSFATIIPLIRRQLRIWLFAQAGVYAILLLLLLGFIEPAADNLRSPRRFAAELLAQLTTYRDQLLIGPMPEEVSAYLPLGLPDALGNREALVVVDDRRQRVRPVAADFLPRVYYRDVASIERVTVTGMEENERWKLFRVSFRVPDPFADDAAGSE